MAKRRQSSYVLSSDVAEALARLSAEADVSQARIVNWAVRTYATAIGLSLTDDLPYVKLFLANTETRSITETHHESGPVPSGRQPTD